MNLKTFEETIRANFAAAIAQGWTPTRETTVNKEEKRVCAIGAWGVANGILEDDPHLDGCRSRTSAPHPKWWDLGKKLAAEFVE